MVDANTRGARGFLQRTLRAGLILLAFLPGGFLCSQLHVGGADQLPQDVYIWQRVWNEPVRAAVANRATNFNLIVALAVEVGWSGKQPRVTRAELDYAALRSLNRPV